VPKLTVADIAQEMLKVFDLDGEAVGVAMEELHNRVKAEEADPEVATKMLTEGFLDAMRRSNEKELREFAGIKFESFSAAGRKPNQPRRRAGGLRAPFDIRPSIIIGSVELINRDRALLGRP
jgi:hypothetical protein